MIDTPTAPRAAPRPFWPPLLAGIALGLVLLLTFMLTGHGLGATGFFTRLAAWSGGAVAFDATYHNAYLGPLLDDGRPLSAWITWQVLGVGLGALAASWSAGRLRLKLDGAHRSGRPARALMALVGGLLAGFGARVAAGCTSGVGLSGTATLAVAGFVFLGAFFAAGLLASRLVRGGPQ
jgi:uncharacterized membrane protein YedE/YeeE